MEVFLGILIPFAGTTLGAACVLFMKNTLGASIHRALAGFAAGVMVAASIWSLLIPSIEQSAYMGVLSFITASSLGIQDITLVSLGHQSYERLKKLHDHTVQTFAEVII